MIFNYNPATEYPPEQQQYTIVYRQPDEAVEAEIVEDSDSADWQYEQLKNGLAPHPSFNHEELFSQIFQAWVGGQSPQEILALCQRHCTRPDYAFAQVALNYIETNYPPTQYEIEAYWQQLYQQYLNGKSSLELRDEAYLVKNIYYQKLHMKAAIVVRKAELAGRLPPVAREKAGLNASMQLADWMEVFEEATGLAVTGDPGSGKTCFINWALGFITNVLEPAEIIVLDTHWHPGKWEGLTVLYEPAAVLEQMRLLVEDELEARKQRMRQGEDLPLLLIVLEEAGDINLHSKRMAELTGDKRYLSLLGDFLIGLGAQGRKYNIFVITINQAGNTAASGMAGVGDYLESFYKIRLGRISFKWAKILGLDTRVIEFLQRQAYPCLAGEVPAIHPTHGGYRMRQKKQPPQPQVNYQVRQLPLTVKLAVTKQNKDWQIGDKIAPIAFHPGGWKERYQALKEGSAALPAPQNTPNPQNPDSEASSESSASSEWDAEDLYQRYLEIRNRREKEMPDGKTAIAISWGMNKQKALQLYDLVIREYAPVWVAEYIEAGKLTIDWKELIRLIWAATDKSRDAPRFAAAKAELQLILDEYDIKLP